MTTYRKENTMEIRKQLEEMPFDRTFVIDESGREESCHATGYEVSFDGVDFWNEYEDSNGGLHYGR